ncbi:hypothetical protein [Mycolicibacterium hippocampi]|uniref:hypothetical protein n=1 Tax=Mycolicibacterium hippocampi TaxID=659824 RepID=UPI0035129282
MEAADRGARALVLDRGYGGGATALSGGITYAGVWHPGTVRRGYADTIDNLRVYLIQEVGDAVSDETLDQCCERALDSSRG